LFSQFAGVVSKEEYDYFSNQQRLSPKQELKDGIVRDPSDVNILIVEDNRLNQKIICRFMDQKGYNYSLANNGQEALDMYEKSNFDLIFMDVEMPVINGIQATQQIRSIERLKGAKRPIPIIGISGNVSEKQVKCGIDSGMNAYLKKPYEKNQVFLMIERYVLSHPQCNSQISCSSNLLRISSK